MSLYFGSSQVWPWTYSLIPERKQKGKTVFALTTDKDRFTIINCLWVCWTAFGSSSLEASQKSTQCVWIFSSGLRKSWLKFVNAKTECREACMRGLPQLLETLGKQTDQRFVPVNQIPLLTCICCVLGWDGMGWDAGGLFSPLGLISSLRKYFVGQPASQPRENGMPFSTGLTNSQPASTNIEIQASLSSSLFSTKTQDISCVWYTNSNTTSILNLQ